MRRGFQSTPSAASAAMNRAIWSGVARSGPWPIAVLAVSPGYHAAFNVARFHSGVGTSPARSPASMIPMGLPNQNARA